ncbi:uncharacterized protein LOC123718026 isoform X1 [Pieris brassicae]|uniref:uncharacterized protein LOC123718026 isoform X1 n=1 Tax=Pieris brassicae TaxID=7116 RepID=UPI001E65E613|nr:uncharacterized protein LOC123718026 isoform X1 [Pieris brassicae]
MKYFIILYTVLRLNYVFGSCNLSLKEDFGSPSPVYLHNGEFLAPNSASGHILLRRSEIVQIACPGHKRFVLLGDEQTHLDVLPVKCVTGKTFRSDNGWVGELKEVTCNGPPWYSAQETRQYCYGRNKMYSTGYNISGDFHKLYDLCFDKSLFTTLYSKHELTPASFFKQISSRPSFIEGDLFGKVRMSQLYKIDNQKKRLREILGDGMDEKYITKIQFLNRGHLSPKADFTLSAEQRASFHYANTAPQWMRGNAGDWAAVEDAVRRRVHDLNTTVTLYTGAYGVMTLADSANKHREIYLSTDQNNNGIVPVPLYFFKLVYDPKKQTAVVFVLINSTYYTEARIDELSFCQDVCYENSKYKWLKWRNDGTHSFCCEYHEFVENINVLPQLKVKGLFY